MNRLLFILIALLLSNICQSQHLYPEKFQGCVFTRFCLDCGTPKVALPDDFASQLVAKLDKKSTRKINGEIAVQILVDSTGTPCLLSAGNKTNITSKKLNLQQAINSTINWKPCVNEKGAQTSSISLLLIFNNGQLSLKRRNFDPTAETNMRSTGTPAMKGSKPSDLTESWTVYNKSNSKIPWDMSRAVAVDKNNDVWIGTDNGVVKISNNEWNIYTVKNSGLASEKYDKNKTTSIRDMAVDNTNNKWFIAGWEVYKYDNNSWTKYDSINSPIKWARSIFVDQDNNIWFSSWEGIAKFDGKNWSSLDSKNSTLPSNKTFGIFVDSKKKIWVGTDKGNICIDGNSNINFNNDNSPLSKGIISKMYEDKKGNLWFALYDTKGADQGMYILSIDGKWKKITGKQNDFFNKNSVGDFLLDEDKQILWIAVHGIGIVKYNIISEKWETYTNENSNVPSVYIEQLSKTADGTIWAATYAGVIKLEKK